MYRNISIAISTAAIFLLAPLHPAQAQSANSLNGTQPRTITKEATTLLQLFGGRIVLQLQKREMLMAYLEEQE